LLEGLGSEAERIASLLDRQEHQQVSFFTLR